MKTTTLLFCLSIFCGNNLRAQNFSVGVSIIGLSFHLKKSPHPHLYKGKIDKKGRVVVNGGFLLNARYLFNANLGVQFSQAIVVHDCSGRFLGMTHAGVFALLPQKKENGHAFGSSFGPMWFYRSNWANLPGFIDTGLFHTSTNQRWQTKFVWHGGLITWRIPVVNRQYFSIEMMPGVPEIFSVGPGYSISPPIRKA